MIDHESKTEHNKKKPKKNIKVFHKTKTSQHISKENRIQHMQVGVGCSIMEMTFEFSNKTRGRKHSQELIEEERKEHGNFTEIVRLEGISEKMDLTLVGEGKLRAISLHPIC